MRKYLLLIAPLLLILIAGPAGYILFEQTGFLDGLYLTVITITTVGYGDISPQTGAGQTLAACIMIIGYSIIAVPTGIVSVELAEAGQSGDLGVEILDEAGLEALFEGA